MDVNWKCSIVGSPEQILAHTPAIAVSRLDWTISRSVRTQYRWLLGQEYGLWVNEHSARPDARPSPRRTYASQGASLSALSAAPGGHLLKYAL